MNYPSDIDPEVIPLCDALNALPGVQTTSSCSGHESDRFMVVFSCDDLRSLLQIARAISPEERWMRVLGIILAAAGAAIVIAARLYHFVEHPEWTEMQALRELWRVWVQGGLLLAAAAALAIANYLRRPGPAVPVILTRDNARHLLRPGLYMARGDHGIEFTARDEEALLDVFMGHYPRGPEAIGAWRDALDEMIAKKLAGRQP